VATSSVDEHEERLRQALEKMDASQAFVFAAACAERQWPIYDRASQGKAWSRAELLRRTLDAVWDWLLRRRGKPQGLARQCEAAILEDIEEDSDQAASNAANVIYGLAAIVESGRKDHVLYAARENLSFIEAFVSELMGVIPSPENVPSIEAHELMQEEIRRQQDDLRVVSGSALLPGAIEGLRSRSIGVSILGEYWYGE
jgi:hypothetical protein